MTIKNILFFLLFLPLLANAQTASIKGTIYSSEESLPFATIELEGADKGTISDEHGFFELTNLDAGDYTVTISYLGYISNTERLSLLADEQQTLDIQLEAQSAHDLEAIVVTGTMKSTYVSASPIKVDVITAKQLDTYLPAAASSVVEGVQLVNGVQEVVACGVCYTNSISINGLPGPYTAILMDGTPMYGSLASVYGLNGIPNMIIDRFEVIKGPSSTLYGSEAVAGVINIITKDPSKQPLLSLDIMGTSHLESFGNIALAPKTRFADGYIGLNYAYINDFDDNNEDGFGDSANLDRYSLFTKWNFKRKSGKLFSLSGKYYFEDRRNGVEGYVTERAYKELRGSDSVYGESIYTNRAELFGTYAFDTNINLKLDFSYSYHLQDSYYGSDFYKAKQNIAFSNLLWNIENKKHDVLVGLTMRYQNYDDNTIATERVTNDGIVNEIDNQFIPGVFVQNEWTISPKWTILAGGRLDHYRAHGLIFSPRLNAKYKSSAATTWRANFGTGFRIVNLFTEDHAFITGQRTVEIAETLQPEESYNATLNFNHIYTLGTSTGTLDIDAYYTYFTNKIIPDYDTPSKIIYANSDGFAQTMGIGLSLNQSFAFPLAFSVSANMQRAIQTEEGETTKIEFAPEWSGIFTANYRWKKVGMTFAYTFRLTGPMGLPTVFDLDAQGNLSASARPTRSKPFSFHNIQITKIFKKNWSMYVGIQNLSNYRQQFSPLIGFNDPTAAPGFSDYFDTSYAYSPIHGRELYVGVKWNWR